MLCRLDRKHGYLIPSPCAGEEFFTSFFSGKQFRAGKTGSRGAAPACDIETGKST
jgi:hypothetical protein